LKWSKAPSSEISLISQSPGSTVVLGGLMGGLPLPKSDGDGDDDDDDNTMSDPLVPERDGDGDDDDDDNTMGNSLDPVNNNPSTCCLSSACCVLGLDCTPDVIVAVGRIGDELKGPSRRN
tara:strand:+ start:506 stop:865 length:360 start_codon:yes stop_codon:yes gene_type:complete